MFRHLPLFFKNSLRNCRLLTIVSSGASLSLRGLLLALDYAESAPEAAWRRMPLNRVARANPLPFPYLPQLKQEPGVNQALIFTGSAERIETRAIRPISLCALRAKGRNA